MNVQELETVRRLKLPIKFFIINNNGYASIRSSQKNYFGRLVAADATSGSTLPDVVAQAAAYGVARPCGSAVSLAICAGQNRRQCCSIPGAGRAWTW